MADADGRRNICGQVDMRGRRGLGGYLTTDPARVVCKKCLRIILARTKSVQSSGH